MKIEHLFVENFLGIERAELALGPGLNVLYGPNDLGKSSLAAALRVALLVPMSSALKQRFYSWYGGDPKVTLTLQDDNGVRWRITKHLAGRGSTKLERSLDGSRFAPEAKDRDADERLRQLLGWGLGDGRGKMPAAFVTHALLADQDELRSIFEASTDDDKEDSGKLRLERALGALAQSPQHKRALEVAQRKVASAFTPTGKLKQGSGSPFSLCRDQLDKLYAQKNQLEDKQRDTQHARERLRALTERREQALSDFETAATQSDAIKRRFELYSMRQKLELQLRTREAMLTEAVELAAQHGTKQAEVVQQEARCRQESAAIERAQSELEAAQTAAAEEQQRRDELTSGRGSLELDLSRLHEREKQAVEQSNEAKRQSKGAEDALARARTLSRELRECIGRVQLAAQRATDAAQALEGASAAEHAADAAVAGAQQRLRDATSTDRASARELARQQLENRRLQLEVQRVELGKMKAQLDDLRLAEERARVAEQAREQSHREAGEAHEAAEAARQELDGLERELAQTQRLMRAAELNKVLATLASALRDVEAADQSVQAASGLRDEARALRQLWSEALPDAARIEELRALQHELEVSAARLTAVAVTIKPRRMLEALITRDGQELPQRLFSSPMLLSADRELTIAIEDLVELEISGGAGDDKADLLALKERWAQEAEPVLAAAKCSSVGELAARSAQRERALALASEQEREATNLEHLARRQRPTELEALSRSRAALEEELGPAADELLKQLAPTGAGVSAELERRRERATRNLVTTREGQAQRTIELARLQAQQEHDERELVQATAHLTALRSRIAEPPGALEARLATERRANEEQLRVLEAEQNALSGGASQEESAARTALAEREGERAAALAQRRTAEAEDRNARDAHITAKAALETARRDALSHDRATRWAAQLADLDGLAQSPAIFLPIEGWQADALAADALRSAAGEELLRLQQEIEAQQQRRSNAIAQAEARASMAKQQVEATQRRLEAQRVKEKESRELLSTCREQLAEIRAANAAVDRDQLIRDVDTLRLEISALPAVDLTDGDEVARAQDWRARCESELRGAEAEQMHAKGALEQVGGAAIDDELRALKEAIAVHEESERTLQVSFEGWRLLAEALSEAEASTSQHLGRILAPAVSRRFRELTSARYVDVELSAQLRTEGITIAGERRDFSMLSSGTQDQLATLLRLCVAEQLRSAILLDDPLCQSDAARMEWFDRALRTSASRVQILFITCHPESVLPAGDRPRGGELFHDSAGGLLRAFDLERIIHRATPPLLERAPALPSPPPL